jgi:hypothetical protein
MCELSFGCNDGFVEVFAEADCVLAKDRAQNELRRKPKELVTFELKRFRLEQPPIKRLKQMQLDISGCIQLVLCDKPTSTQRQNVAAQVKEYCEGNSKGRNRR